MSKRVVITGSNRGIGFEIASQLGDRGWHVILTARNPEKGENAANELKKLGYDVDFFQLDVASESSIGQFANNYGGKFKTLDVLINNAGVFLDGSKTLMSQDMEIVKRTMDINFYGAFLMVRSMAGFLEGQNGRIINISSGLGALNEMGGGYGSYRISKAAMNAMTAVFAAELGEMGISVNSMCPGWVKTDMGGSEATREVSKGAETAVWLATHPDIPNGKFLRDMKVIDW